MSKSSLEIEAREFGGLEIEYSLEESGRRFRSGRYLLDSGGEELLARRIHCLVTCAPECKGK